MKSYKDIEYCRCVVNLEKSVKEWYQDEAALMSLPMGQYMAVVLVEHFRKCRNADTVREFNELLHSDEWKQASKESGEMLELFNQMMIDDIKDEPKKEEPKKGAKKK